ncbi:uncharacterized protein B0P05DRAFT_48981 [Gilbertella persicaria]|uniref:uncharacterized protein n=1 Tax=Gilbertella persicaria TaxID=101096 RepID=UPI0022206269|nr:uncharacterized protein B0P05DRAFT_48981 [Gilbertella persicaria]KAI8083253.1 hypothetical protein B0P05DRAFT_48981 [Gilbertella persicaria]
MLQRLGFVDLVFTGDNDVFLFGAQRVVRQWPSKRNEAVSCYDMRWVSDTVGLDRSDLILMALLRGSDYDTKGTKGIGIQVATQLAKCRFHRGLMDDIQLTGRHVSLDEERVQHLYDDLTYELQHNNTKNLTKRHTGIVLDPTFPDFSIVTDFIHPLTNICRPESKLKAQRLASCLDHHQEPNWTELAHFIQHTFKWPAEYVLKRFSSLLFPAFMKNKISQQYHERYRPTPRVQPTTQPRLEDYYRPTSRLFRDRQPRIVHITHKKQALCRVEWHKSCWEQFLSLLKPKLDYELYQQETDVLDQEVMDYKQEMQANDIFDAIKRQWIAVDHIQALYSHLQTNALFIPKRKKINY